MVNGEAETHRKQLCHTECPESWKECWYEDWQAQEEKD